MQIGDRIVVTSDPCIGVQSIVGKKGKITDTLQSPNGNEHQIVWDDGTWPSWINEAHLAPEHLHFAPVSLNFAYGSSFSGNIFPSVFDDPTPYVPTPTPREGAPFYSAPDTEAAEMAALQKKQDDLFREKFL